jgi:ribonuclease D
LKLDSPRTPVHYVSDPGGLQALLNSLKGLTQVSLDAERASGFRYSQRAYLIQLATATEIFLVDPTALDESAPGWNLELAGALREPTWLLHAATQDLPCLAELEIRPTSLIDTELAARLAGLSRVGLGSLCEELLELELAKEHSAADWSIRPLSEAMLNYAALDVDVMAELWEKLSALLKEQGKLDWANQEFEHLVGFRPKTPSEEPWRNLPGFSKLKEPAKQRAAAALWLRRDQIARDSDTAPGRLFPDRSLMAAVSKLPSSKSELAANKEFNGRASRSKLSDWWQAISESASLDIDLGPKPLNGGIPSHRSWEKRFPEAHQRLEVIRPLVAAKAEELGLPIENLLTPDYLRRVCFAPESDIASQLEVLGARSWQIEICTPIIQAGLIQAQNQQSA